MVASSKEVEKGFLWDTNFKLWAKNEWELASLKVIGDYFKGTTIIQQLAPENSYLFCFFFWWSGFVKAIENLYASKIKVNTQNPAPLL